MTTIRRVSPIERSLVTKSVSPKSITRTPVVRRSIQLGLVCVCVYSFGGSAACAGDSAKAGLGAGPDGKEPSDPIERLIAQVVPVMAPLGFAGVMGFCSGVAAKRVSRESAYLVGVGFCILQGLSYMGYIHVNYTKVADDAKNALDADGDGQLTSKGIIGCVMPPTTVLCVY